MVRVYGVELSFNNKAEVLRLPINPSEIEVSESGQGSTYDVVGLGQNDQIKALQESKAFLFVPEDSSKQKFKGRTRCRWAQQPRVQDVKLVRLKGAKRRREVRTAGRTVCPSRQLYACCRRQRAGTGPINKCVRLQILYLGYRLPVIAEYSPR